MSHGGKSGKGGEDAMCVECEDQEAAIMCINCEEPFCRPCYDQQHRKGKRSEHRTRVLLGELMPESMGITVKLEEPAEAAKPAQESVAAALTAEPMDEGADKASKPVAEDGAKAENGTEEQEEEGSGERFAFHVRHKELTRHIPMRLTQAERDLLHVVEGALRVSEYTDKVDTLRWGKDKEVVEQLTEMCELIMGLYTCVEFKAAQKLVKNDMEDNAAFLQAVFEVGRRFKIMNPEKMRSTYGKLMYLLQDAVCPDYAKQMGFSFKRGILTVESFLAERDGLALLDEKRLLEIATADVSLLKDKAQTAAFLAQKKKATEDLCRKHTTERLSKDDIERVLLSISDSNNYQAMCSTPVIRMIEYLKEYFDPSSTEKGSLDIAYGRNGSKLSHSHATQYTYVLQTLTLWKTITEQMFYLWNSADSDLLNPKVSYRLWNTGQGLNRVQQCPNVSDAMHSILRSVQLKCGSWVGLSVVHLGDRDVPNALMFIDKYTQVPRILAPIVHVLDSLEQLARDESIHKYITSSFKSIEHLRRGILADFFRHAFDGDGDDGGSCIDGRLTSAWNWCSKLEKKSYYPVFLLADFQGFDGSFRA